MPKISSCPDRPVLQRFSLGQLPADEIEGIESHLSVCGLCLASLEQLASTESLVDAVRAQAATAPPSFEDDSVRELMAWLQGQPPLAGLEATADSAVMSAPSSVDATLAPDSVAATLVNAERVRYDFLAPPEKADEIGRLGPFRVLEVLGSGGMGLVFRAESLELKRPVALKVMRPSAAAIASARERFLREARTAAAIEHEHVVTIYQVGEDRSVPFLAMQLLKGESLDDRLEREGRLPIAEVLRIGREVALGLAAAHERGLIHRDIKPANLWLESERGRVKILDFGLARAARDSVHLTQSGLIVGTPAFMAPEQSRATGINPRTDLFSLGCVLYRCCTGRLPFNGTDTISILASLALDEPLPPPQFNVEVPAGLSNLVMRLLAKDPAKRPPSAHAVIESITALEAGKLDASSNEADLGEIVDVPHDAKPRRRRRWPFVLAAAVLLPVLGLLAYWYASTVLPIAANKGQIVLETDDPDVEVRVERNGELVTALDAKTSKEVALQAGTYQLELVDAKDGLRISPNRFTLLRGDRQVISVRWEPVVVLQTPAEGAVLPNGPPSGVPWQFSWSAVPKATRYHLLVYGPSASVPLIDEDRLPGTAYRYLPNGYVVERNRKGWRWKVRTCINNAWSDWSEERSFDVAPWDGPQKP